MVYIRKPYDYSVSDVSSETSFISINPTVTQQQFKDESDINTIVDRFLRTGEPPFTDARAIYGDYLNAPDSYQEALNLVLDAQAGFDSLPADLRARFQNDPAELLSFLQDDKNLDEAISLGLVEKPAVNVAVEQLKTAKKSAKAASPEPSTVEST